MANLIIDIGNTALKASWADGITLGKTFSYQGERMIEFIFSLLEKEKPEVMVISSARNFSNQNITRLKQMCDRLVIVDNEILEHYSLPDCLTPDRAASIIAAKYLFKGRGCTIFDFGTTMSIDFISKEGEYEGGNISVGCRTRFKALNRYTKNLPLVENPFEIEISGKNIQSSIASGVITGIMFEIEGYLGRYPENVAELTGGDAIYFAKRMKNSIFVVCNLVLMGLALIAFGQKELCPEV